MNQVGIEDARKFLGDIANRAHMSGTVTLLTRRGKNIAAVVPITAATAAAPAALNPETLRRDIDDLAATPAAVQEVILQHLIAACDAANVTLTSEDTASLAAIAALGIEPAQTVMSILAQAGIGRSGSTIRR